MIIDHDIPGDDGDVEWVQNNDDNVLNENDKKWYILWYSMWLWWSGMSGNRIMIIMFLMEMINTIILVIDMIIEYSRWIWWNGMSPNRIMMIIF